MTQVFSVFERLGMGGGGKVKAVYHRLNSLASLDGITPVLLNLDHRPNQKINFARFQQAGVLAPGVAYMRLPDGADLWSEPL